MKARLKRFLIVGELLAIFGIGLGEIVWAPASHALSLGSILHTVVQPLQTVLSPSSSGPSNSSGGGSGAATSTPSAEPASTQPTPATTSDAEPTAPVQTPPIENDPQPLQPMRPSVPTPTAASVSPFRVNILSGLAQLNLGRPISTDGSQAVLEPSSQGWKIEGIAWYWWLLVLAGSLAVGLAFRQFLGLRLLHLLYGKHSLRKI